MGTVYLVYGEESDHEYHASWAVKAFTERKAAERFIRDLRVDGERKRRERDEHKKSEPPTTVRLTGTEEERRKAWECRMDEYDQWHELATTIVTSGFDPNWTEEVRYSVAEVELIDTRASAEER